MSTDNTITKTDLKNILEEIGNIGGGGATDATPIPTANATAAFDSSTHMNSEDMTSSEIDSFVGGLDMGAGGLLNMFYPVGSYYETSDSTFNPNVRWGGTWILEAEGQVHISAGANYDVGDTGGEATHTLTVDEMPAHQHPQLHDYDQTNPVTPTTGGYITGHYVARSGSTGRTPASYLNPYTSAGGSLAHNNMQPYIVVNRWHRTA